MNKASKIRCNTEKRVADHSYNVCTNYLDKFWNLYNTMAEFSEMLYLRSYSCGTTKAGLIHSNHWSLA